LNEIIKDLETKKTALQNQVAQLQGEAGPQLAAWKARYESAAKQIEDLTAANQQANKNVAAAQARAEQQAADAKEEAAVAQQKLTDLTSQKK